MEKTALTIDVYLKRRNVTDTNPVTDAHVVRIIHVGLARIERLYPDLRYSVSVRCLFVWKKYYYLHSYLSNGISS